MMSDWYEVIKAGDEITQGDIIFNCYIPLPNKNFYEELLAGNDEIESPIDVLRGNLIILSQACDIENGKIDSIVTCPVSPLIELIKKQPYFRGSDAKESLRQGREPAYHLLNECKTDALQFDFSVVDFHRIYSLPKAYIKKIAESNAPRLRLVSPYKEHLSQAFARYFMRVGLPLDIPKEKIKAVSAS